MVVVEVEDELGRNTDVDDKLATALFMKTLQPTTSFEHVVKGLEANLLLWIHD